MIIDFTIKNFRSIKCEQLLSLYADKKPRHHAGNIAFIENKLGVLRTCAIYGSNASGKTNVILAFKALQELITESGGLKEGESIKNYEPYLLSQSTRDLPTRFEIEFYVDSTRYLYCIEYNSKEIVFEKLDFYPTARAANIFTRNFSDDWKTVKFGERFKGGKKRIAFFANNTYLSKAGNSPDSPEVIRKIFNYFRTLTHIIVANQAIGVFDWYKNEQTVSIVNTFLKRVDLGIEKFGIEKDGNSLDLKFPKEMPELLQQKFKEEFSKKEFFYHPDDNGELVRFESDRESSGTIKLFSLLPVFINVLREGAVLFLDEIEGSFHPHIAELILKLFNDPLVNKNNAQLIFTTHDLSLMESGIMRKDQIYLSEKNSDSGTNLYCLDGYENSLKDNSPFSKWYGEGRLGAIPKINYRDISSVIKNIF